VRGRLYLLASPFGSFASHADNAPVSGPVRLRSGGDADIAFKQGRPDEDFADFTDVSGSGKCPMKPLSR